VHYIMLASNRNIHDLLLRHLFLQDHFKSNLFTVEGGPRNTFHLCAKKESTVEVSLITKGTRYDNDTR